uniref:Zinc finger PHD-type domain-containing protein n=1 Tax=Rhodnius prolixus TaxID=13249 RepID=T1IEC7_RHOPR
MKENLNATQEVNAPLAIASTSSSGAITSFEEISPIPRFQKPKQTRRKKQTAEVLTTVEKREILRRKATLPTKKGGKVQQKKERKDSSSSASSAPDNLVMTSGESDIEEEDDDFCIECKGYFYDRKGPKCDWLQCITCKRWLHEICIAKNVKN